MRTRYSRLVIGLLVLSAAFWMGRPAVAAGNGPIFLSARGHGVAFSVTIPHRAYAPNALMATRVEVTNTSRQSIFLWFFPQYCGSYNPEILVSNDSGKVLYPPPIPTLVPLPCVLLGTTLRPGHSTTATQYAIARGRNLRAALKFQGLNGSFGPITLTTRSVRLGLVSRPAVTVTLHTSSTAVYAVIHKPAGARGPLRYATDDRCFATARLLDGLRILQWVTSSTTRLTATCDAPYRWVVAAGWVGYPVAQIDYSRT